MRISFDLDSTLIPHANEFPVEKMNFLAKLFKVEPLREGTKELFDYLETQGHSINIYTTSLRSILKIRFQFYTYGIKIDRVINQYENQKHLNRLRISSSKYPPAFNFDVHIDDLFGVAKEGERFNFRTIIVEPNDKNWVTCIKK